MTYDSIVLPGLALDGNAGTRHATIKRRPTLNLIHSELNVINFRHWIFKKYSRQLTMSYVNSRDASYKARKLLKPITTSGRALSVKSVNRENCNYMQSHYFGYAASVRIYQENRFENSIV